MVVASWVASLLRTRRLKAAAKKLLTSSDLAAFGE
jgi:hypothetical protein